MIAIGTLLPTSLVFPMQAGPLMAAGDQKQKIWGRRHSGVPQSVHNTCLPAIECLFPSAIPTQSTDTSALE